MKEQIDKWVDEGVIVSSRSEYASPLVIVKKSNGDMRLCGDYRKLNEKVIKDLYPIPRVDDSLEVPAGAKFFSSFDRYPDKGSG